MIFYFDFFYSDSSQSLDYGFVKKKLKILDFGYPTSPSANGKNWLTDKPRKASSKPLEYGLNNIFKKAFLKFIG